MLRLRRFNVGQTLAPGAQAEAEDTVRTKKSLNRLG